MLEDVARKNEIVGSIAIGMRLDDIEIGLAVVEGIHVVELPGQTRGVILLVTESKSPDGGKSGELGKKEGLPEQLDGKQIDKRPQANVRFAAAAAR